MFLTDIEIQNYSLAEDMIDPFIDHQIKSENGKKIISYGLSSRGYDLRINNKFKKIKKETLLDVKNLDNNIFEDVTTDEIIIPPQSFILGCTVEKLKIPKNIIGICLGKSSWARIGIIINVTPIEPGWSGFVTIEISNTTNCPVKIYAFEGICQILFDQGRPCNIAYNDRNGKYQNQKKEVVITKL